MGMGLMSIQDFSGLLSLLFAGWWPKALGGQKEMTDRAYEEFNGDLKRWVEREEQGEVEGA